MGTYAARYYDTFLKYIGADFGGSPNPNALLQVGWTIDPAAPNASDSNDGSPANPLKTWGEYTRRLGQLTTIAPPGGFSAVAIRSDLAPDDPVKYNNFLHCLIVVLGTEKVLAAGAFTNVTAQDFPTNTRNQVGDIAQAPGFFDAFRGNMIRATSGASAGAYANISGSNGAFDAYLGDWIQDVNIDGLSLTFPAAPPAPGDTYEILDFVQVSMGNVDLGSDGTFKTPALNIPGGVVFYKTRFRDDGLTYPKSFGNNIGGTPTLFAYRQCLFDCDMETVPSTTPGLDVDIAACGFRGNLDWRGGGFELQSVHAPDPFRGGDTFIRTLPGAYNSGRNVRQGELATGATADLWALSPIDCGAVGVWDSRFGIYVDNGSFIQESGQFFGDLTEILWGDGNTDEMFIGNQSAIECGGFNGGLLPVLKNTTVGAHPWTSFVNNSLVPGHGVRSCSFDPVTGLFSPLAIDNTYANLSTLVGAFGFATVSVPGTVIAAAINPQSGARFLVDLFP